MLTLSMDPVVSVCVGQLEISFTTSIPANVYYTLDGKSPMCPTAILWDGSPVVVSGSPSRDVTVRAVAYDDTYISNQISQVVRIVDVAGDDDLDGITNTEEVAPDIDTDMDGIPDYVDVDSDNDGKSDLYEGAADYNSNGIPNFRDPGQHPKLIYEFYNFPPSGPLVENVPYIFSVKILNGSGVLDIVEDKDFLAGIDTTTDPIQVSEGEEYVFTVMPIACRSSDTENLRFTFTDLFDDEITGVNADLAFVTESEEYPRKGIQIAWKKNIMAKAYRIYRKMPNDIDFSLLTELPHDPTPHVQYQWYIDRTGDIHTRYSVSAVDDDGLEGVRSLPKHAPDIDSNTCLIQGNIADVNMQPVKGVTVACKVKTNPAIFGNTVIYKGSMLVYTDSRGYFELVVPQGAIVVLNIDEVGFKKSIIIPHVSSISLKELMQMPQNIGG